MSLASDTVMSLDGCAKLLRCLLELFLCLHTLRIRRHRGVWYHTWLQVTSSSTVHTLVAFIHSKVSRVYSGLVLNLDMNWLVVWFINRVRLILSWSWCLLACNISDASIHSVIHHSAFIQARATLIEWIFVASLASIFTSIVCNWLRRPGVRSSIVWDNTATNYPKSTWIFALSSLLLLN